MIEHITNIKSINIKDIQFCCNYWAKHSIPVGELTQSCPNTESEWNCPQCDKRMQFKRFKIVEIITEQKKECIIPICEDCVNGKNLLFSDKSISLLVPITNIN